MKFLYLLNIIKEHINTAKYSQNTSMCCINL